MNAEEVTHARELCATDVRMRAFNSTGPAKRAAGLADILTEALDTLEATQNLLAETLEFAETALSYWEGEFKASPNDFDEEHTFVAHVRAFLSAYKGEQ